MPMVPSLLAAATYVGLKIGGYSLAGFGINKLTNKSYSVFKFGLLKTALGFVGGFSIFLMAVTTSNTIHYSDLVLYLIAIPVRLLVWVVVIDYCFKLWERKILLFSLAAAGTVWSYILDYIMKVIYGAAPGMTMPWC